MRKFDWAPIPEGEETGADRITRHVDEAMSKLQLLTNVFESEDMDTNMCHEAIGYVVDGIAHDLGEIYEAVERKTDRQTATGGEDLSGIPYVEVGYADGSKERMTGPFDLGAMADVARLMGRESADAMPF